MEYVYAVLLLHKLGKEINEKNIKSVVAATGISVNEAAETKIKSLVASLKDVDISKELESAILTAAAPAVVVEAVKEEKPKEEKREAAAEGLSALFG
ncbi:MAG TPA: 50S ribosomal protein L12 [Candidatus Nanoarchaeia archaeon]|nr:50S ribosomal protein L12 [Candidatus Nanoarchaeia archaeon]